MRAVWLRQFGGPEVLVATEVPDPVAGPGQALIEVAFTNITFVETQFRASGAGPFKAELPMVLGNASAVWSPRLAPEWMPGTGRGPGCLALDSAVVLLADNPDQAAATRGVTVVRGPMAAPGELRAFTDGRLRDRPTVPAGASGRCPRGHPVASHRRQSRAL